MSADVTWIARLDLALVRQWAGARAVDLALGSDLAYVQAPAVAAGAVRAVLGQPSRAFDLALREDDEGALHAECSQCSSRAAPCAHATVLAVDLAGSRALREALALGRDTRDVADGLPEARRAAERERALDRGLRAWLAPPVRGLDVEIAATPWDEEEPTAGRPYGERAATGGALVALFVRHAGGAKGSKLLAPREVLAAELAPRDRRILELARERGARRRALYVTGVEASVAIEAMRAHGGVFAAGFAVPLSFRPAAVRPAIDLDGAGALVAAWTSDDGATRIAFEDAAYFDGPFPFVWSRAGAIHPVAPDVDRDLVTRLVGAPALHVPPARRAEAGTRVLRALRGRGVILPSPEALGVAPIETPRFVLRLAGEPLDVTGELVAAYSFGEVPLLGGAPSPRDRDVRDFELEDRAVARATRAGLVSGGRVGASDEAAASFWREGLLALRAETDPRVEVVLSERLARVRVAPPVTARAHVALEDRWLLTRVEFAARELPVEMGAVREALARKRRWVALSDGAIARIESSIASLAQGAEGLLDDAGEGRLPLHQIGRVTRWIEEHDGHVDAALEALRRRLTAREVPEPELPRGLRAELRPYQRQGVAWLQFLRSLGAGGVLADDMGLGKTITTLAFLLRWREAEGPAPALVVCPTSVATNWLRESARFTPDLRALLLHGGSRRLDAAHLAEHDLVVTTYALLRRDVEALAAIPFRCAVLDEAQHVKNAEGATRRAAGRLRASMRLALTGTPVENRLGELWSLMSFANPGMLGSARAFETRYERPVATDAESPLAAELRAIVRPFLLRRTKDDVLRELPPKTEIDRYVTLTRTEKRAYDALAHTVRASLKDDPAKRARRGGGPPLSVFTALVRLRQMACDPRLVDPSAVEPRGAKRETFLSLVRELVAEGRRALVFSQFVSLFTLWREDLDAESIPYEYLDGSTTNRDAIVDRFQRGGAPLFLLSLKAGGAGLNLTAADTVIHCDPWWNPAVEDQASDRAYRIGQEKPVTVVRLVARGTIEEKLVALKEKKRALARAVVADDAAALAGITEEDLRMLLGDDAPAERDADDAPLDEAIGDEERAALVARVRRWLDETGRSESELAEALEIPIPIASRLARGEPFPCSRATARSILARVRSWR